MDLQQDSDREHLYTLRLLLECLERIWDEYCRRGPGQVESSLFDGVNQLAHRFDEQYIQFASSNPRDALSDDPRPIVVELCRLARRCACTSEGLYFVTGEAGLIRRKDQEQAYAEGLSRIRRLVDID